MIVNLNQIKLIILEEEDLLGNCNSNLEFSQWITLQ